jgi:hypothetical protein
MQPEPPPEYAAFVTARRTWLTTACRELTANSYLAGSVARELLAMVALRWRRLRGSDAATAYLDRLVRREARAWRGGRAAAASSSTTNTLTTSLTTHGHRPAGSRPRRGRWVRRCAGGGGPR